MRKTTSHKKNWLQRLKYYKPLFPVSGKKKNNSRIKQYSFDLNDSRKIDIKLRRFRTQAENRLKKNQQIVIKIKLFSFKEIVFQLITNKKKTKSKSIKNQLVLVASRSLMLLGLFGLTLFGHQILNFNSYNPPYVDASPAIIEQKETPISQSLQKSEPVNISIPSIDVSADIHEVGLLPNGSLETPEVMSGLVGWYRNSPTPGEIGPSVLVGHVDTFKGPSVFWNLGNLQDGDIITISRKDNSEAEFIVRQKVVYDQRYFETDEVYGNIEYAGLRVITCGGAYNHITGRYSHNTVIFAELNKNL